MSVLKYECNMCHNSFESLDNAAHPTQECSICGSPDIEMTTKKRKKEKTYIPKDSWLNKSMAS